MVFYNVYGVKIDSDLDAFPRIFRREEKFKSVDLIVKKKDFDVKNTYKKFSVKFRYENGKYVAFDTSFKFYNFKLMVKNLTQKTTEVYYNKCGYVENKLYNLKHIISRIFLYKLLKNGLLLLHCGGVEIDKKGVLIFAPSDTGKTSTVLSLAKKLNAKIIGDDVCLCDLKSVYRYTDMLSIYPKSEFFPPSLRKKILCKYAFKRTISFIPYLSLKIHPNLKLPVEYFGEPSERAKIRKVYFLEKDKNLMFCSISGEEALNKILSVNYEILALRGNFPPVFWRSLCYAFKINPFELEMGYAKSIEKLLKKAEVFLVKGKDYHAFSEKISETV